MKEEKNAGHVPVCFITDNRYALPTMVAIRSLYLNSGLNKRYRIIVFAAEDLTEDNRRALEQVAPHVKVCPVEPVRTLFPAPSAVQHVSTAALYKFYLAEILKDEDKALYIDSDVLFLRDLEKLLQTELNGAYAAAVESFTAPVYLPELLSNLGVRHYFSSGMMLLNLKRMREENLCEKLVDYRLNGWTCFMDQDALNAVFHEEVVFLPIEYNLQCTTVTRLKPEEACRRYGVPVAGSWDEVCDRSTILHYASSKKPWQYGDIWKAELWLYYYSRLPRRIREANPLARMASPKLRQPLGGKTKRGVKTALKLRHSAQLPLRRVIATLCRGRA